MAKHINSKVKNIEKCHCWREESYRQWFGPDESYAKTEQVCYGTKEMDHCSCGGDRSKCDFYPEVREKSKAEIKKKLDAMELEFYRYYILKNDLVWDAMNEYSKWSKTLDK